MIASGNIIRKLGIFTPFSERTEVLGMTYGCGPAGYDVRVEFDRNGIIDETYIEPGEFMLVSTIEHFTMPVDWLAVIHDKSSWARRGLTVQNTVVEPGWNGFLTLELTNHSNKAIPLLRGMPIAQVILHRIGSPMGGYTGKYQDQGRGPQGAR